MVNFALIAGLAASVNAAAYVTSSAPPSYESAPAYYPSESSSAPAYPAYPAESSSAPAYGAYPAASSSAPAYGAYPAASSSAPAYEAYPVTHTTTVKGLTTVCSEATTFTYGTKTYSVTKPTTVIDEDCEYTTTYVTKPTTAPGYPVHTPVYSAPAPPHYPVAPSSNGTVPHPTGSYPTKSHPATPEFTGAAGKASVGLLAVVGAVAAFL